MIQELDRTGVPLGILDGGKWQQRVVQLAPGDALLLYTDGITEAQNAQEAFFDEDRLGRLFVPTWGIRLGAYRIA